jgi:2-methylisocitrate lyase-like PEP mutase family enzyme
MFRRRGDARRPSAALLRNYLARAQAIADAGGGNLWLIEPTLRPEAMSAFTEAVARHVTTHGIVTAEITVFEGRTSARIAVLAAPRLEITLPEQHLSSPTTRR